VIGGRDSLTEAPLETIERLDGFLGGPGALENQKWEIVPLINKDQ
jgi:hypothetical protein